MRDLRVIVGAGTVGVGGQHVAEVVQGVGEESSAATNARDNELLRSYTTGYGNI